MAFEIVVKDDFVKSFSILPEKYKKRISDFIFKTIPYNDYPYGLFQKMKGYKTYFKKRFGDYRLGVEIDKTEKKIYILTIMHRKEIYKYFPPEK